MSTSERKHGNPRTPLLLWPALLLAAALPLRPGMAQEARSELPDPAALEAQYEQAFAAALETPDSEPLAYLQAWNKVLMSALAVEQARAIAEGRGASGRIEWEAISEQVFERWRRLRPDSPGPELFRTLRIQDPAQKRAAVLSLLDRYPDEVMVAWQVWVALRESGETARATETLESFVARNPEDPGVHRLLVRDAAGNETRRAEILKRWAQAHPGDPHLVMTWLRSKLPEQKPDATTGVLRDFFARRSGGEAALSACLAVRRSGEAAYSDAAAACIARLAGDPESSPELAGKATAALAKVAAEEGDWSGLVALLDQLEPRARWNALLGAARQLEAPARCGERVDVLEAAQVGLPDDDAYGSLASALKDCAVQPGAQALFLSLLRKAPVDRVKEIVLSWVIHGHQGWVGALPDATAVLLEERLEGEPNSAALYEALDLVYQVADAQEQRFDLLRRWHQRSPASFGAEPAIALSEELWARGQQDAALELLQRHPDQLWQAELAEQLWTLWVEGGHSERAEGLAAELIASEDPWRAATGHLLAARSAVLREDLDAAEAHYWTALNGLYAHRDVAVEMLATLAAREDRAGLRALAVRTCEAHDLAPGPGKVSDCAADLLTRAGASDAAAEALTTGGSNLPEDLESLHKLASTAQSAGQIERAHRALLRILEIDPRSPGNWSALGVFLERQGRVNELADLLRKARERFSPPPSELSRAAGRALTEAGQPRRAIDILLKARAKLTDDSGGEWTRGWIDAELRDAYRVLGNQLSSGSPREAAASGHPPGAGHDLGLALLQAGAGAEERDRALALLRQAAESPDALAAEILAFLHATGVYGVPRDPAEARRWMTEAARLGSDGFTGLRKSREDGDSEGVFEKLVDQGLQRLERLAEESDPAAAAFLAYLYTVGFAPEGDPKRTVALARIGAAQGQALAMRTLSHAYKQGVGVERNEEQALRWQRRCAQAGDSFCMMFYAQALMAGKGVARDLETGLDWLRRAAESGNWWAVADMGRLYDEGWHGLPRDPDDAAAWKRRLAGLGDPETRGWLAYHGYPLE